MVDEEHRQHPQVQQPIRAAAPMTKDRLRGLSQVTSAYATFGADMVSKPFPKELKHIHATLICYEVKLVRV